jgi:GH35 family endo-1,4-beta-xylanase
MKTFIASISLLLSFFFLTCTKPDAVVSAGGERKLINVPLKDINPDLLVGAPIEIHRGFDKYNNTIKTEFSTGQSLWYGRWGGWSGEQLYDFNEFNQNVNWMVDNGLSPTMHMLVGPDNYMPNWLVNGNRTPQQLDNLLRQLIYNIMDSNNNKEKVDVWNVANELFDDDGTYRTNMVWRKLGWENDNSGLTGDDKLNTQHPLFVRKAFTYCRDKTGNKLEIRDFNTESDDPSFGNYRKCRALYQLIKHMLNSGIPIDAVGFQGHFDIGKCDVIFNNNRLKETVYKFKSLGIDVNITELDFRTNFRTWNQALADQQKKDYYNYVQQAIDGGASRINFWGIQDDFDPAWLLKEHPLPWDANLEKKPAYFGVAEAIDATK